MTQEEKQLLLQDLCARLPYGIYANLPNHHLVSHKYYIYEINVKNDQQCTNKVEPKFNESIHRHKTKPQVGRNPAD